MSVILTEKSKNLITIKEFGGIKYALCDKSNDVELWLKIEDASQPTCSRCGYTGASVERHHIHGRKNSKETIDLCANCHRETHAGVRSI